MDRSRGKMRENDKSQDLPVRPASETRSVKPMVKICVIEDRDEVIERS